jgi:hypothetical protein
MMEGKADSNSIRFVSNPGLRAGAQKDDPVNLLESVDPLIQQAASPAACGVD